MGHRPANLEFSWKVHQGDEFAGIGRDLDRTFAALDERDDRLEAWILAIGVGPRPSELMRLQRLLGRPLYTMGGPQPHAMIRDPNTELTQPAVEAALLLTADLIYRLWQSDNLRMGEPWDE
jgi:hypothetical protein